MSTSLAVGSAMTADPLIGEVVDRYRIERELGRGGMSVVYLARHEELGNLAAVKTIAPPVSPDDKARARFIREAKALGRVQAEGLVSVLNVGALSSGLPYILMEYIEGQNLRARLQEAPCRRLPIELALSLTAQVASTLTKLHAEGVVHRDLKPDNIMLVADEREPGGERTKLLDLGIAKLLEESVSTQTGVTGTPLYMSPEACLGSSVDGQSDIYSLGCVLYELLCGRPPYLPDGGNISSKHIFQSPDSPRKHLPELPRAVSAFVLELLTRQPSARPTAVEVAKRARELLGGRPSGTSWWRRWLWRRLRMHMAGMRLALLLGMPLLIMLAVLILGADWLVRVLPPARWVGLIVRNSSMVRIPMGQFIMGSSNGEREVARSIAIEYDRTIASERHSYTAEYETSRYLEREAVERVVELPSFLMDRYEVTNYQFARFLNVQLRAGRISVKDYCPKQKQESKTESGYQCVYTTDQIPYKNLHRDPLYGGIIYISDRFEVPEEFRKRPVVAVSWQAATEFCAAQGKRLPTEAEWEYVARRGGRRFPWGDRVPRCEDSVLERSSGEEFSSCRLAARGIALPDVGSMANDQSLDGVYDLAGSVAEWTTDSFVKELAATSVILRSPRQEPAPGATSIERVIRGGGWSESFTSARGAARFRARQDILHAATGFRCVRDLK